jgi:hypothetical protein
MSAGDISGWAVIGSSYNTSKACDAARSKLLKAQKKRDADPNGHWGDEDFPIQGLEMSQCMKNGDPELWGRDLAKDVSATPEREVHPWASETGESKIRTAPKIRQ